GDGFADILVGGPGVDTAGPNVQFNIGAACLLFGKAADFGPSVDLLTLPESAGATFLGIDAQDAAGAALAGAGDVNGDGLGDLLVGATAARGAANAHDRCGEGYLLYAKNFPASSNLASVMAANTADGIGFNGIDAFDFAFENATSAGDLNGDGA